MGFGDALIFTYVMEYHSSIQAAQSLGMQKSTASRCITLLEECLGVRLLNRTIRELRLIEIGQVYCERCWQIMYDFTEAEQAVMQLQQAPSGLLRTALPTEFDQMFSASLLGDFMYQYSQITARVELAPRSVDSLQEGVDIVIMVGQPKDSILVAHRPPSTSRWLYASPNYLTAYGMPASVAEPAGHYAALLSTDSQRHWPLSGDSLFCQQVLSCNNITFTREVVAVGAGITALPALIYTRSVRSGRLVRLLADVPLPVGKLYAIYLSRRFQAMKVKAFPDFLISRLPVDIGRLLEPEATHLITSRL